MTNYKKDFLDSKSTLPRCNNINQNKEDHLWNAEKSNSQFNTTYNQDFRSKSMNAKNPEKKILKFKSHFYNDKS